MIKPIDVVVILLLCGFCIYVLAGCSNPPPKSLALPEEEAISDYGCWVDRYPPHEEEREHAL